MSNRLPVMSKQAVVRKPGVRECPFGLPISLACQHAGDSVDHMTTLEDAGEGNQDKQIKANRRVYVFHQDGERCVYADRIVKHKDAVHCDWGEGGARMRDFPVRPSPFYPRVFHGLGQYGLYSYPVNDYIDNHGARQFFTGIFSMYNSTGEIMINKVSMEPDPVLEKLAANLSINEN